MLISAIEPSFFKDGEIAQLVSALAIYCQAIGAAGAVGSNPTGGDIIDGSSPQHPRVYVLLCICVFGLTQGKTCDSVERHADKLERQLKINGVPAMGHVSSNNPNTLALC